MSPVEQLDEEELQEFYRHEYLLELVGDSPLITCKEKYIEDSFIFLREINEYAHAIYRGRMNSVVSARTMSKQATNAVSFLTDVKKGTSKAAKAAAKTADKAIGKVTGLVSESTSYKRFEAGEVSRGTKMMDYFENVRARATGDLSKAVGTNNAMDAAVTTKTFDDLEAGEGAVFGRSSSSTKQTKTFEFDDGTQIQVPYVKNAKGNIQLDLDKLDPNEYGKLQRKLLENKDDFVKKAWDQVGDDVDAQGLVRRITGSEVAGGRIRRAPIKGDNLWDSTIIKRNEVVNKSMFKTVIRRKMNVTHKMGFDEAGYKKVGKEVVAPLGSKKTVHLPSTDVGYMAARGKAVDDVIKSVAPGLHNKALEALKKQGIPSKIPNVVDVEFELRYDAANGKQLPVDSADSLIRQNEKALDAGQGGIRIKQFEDAIADAAGDPELIDHLKKLEKAKLREMLDPKINKRMDASGLIDGETAGDAFEVTEFVSRWRKATVESASELKSMGSMKHQFNKNTTETLSDAPKYVSIEEGTANKMQMIYQIKAQPQMSKKIMKSMDYLDENPKLKAEAFKGMAYDICGKKTCSDAEWNEFKAADFYQSAGIHWGSGLPINGTRYVPDLTLRSNLLKQGISGTYTDKVPRLISPDIKGWSKKGSVECNAKNDCFIIMGDGKGYPKNIDISKNKGDYGDRVRSWAYEKTARNICRRNPVRCTGAFLLALGGTVPALAENWMSCDDRFFPVENKLLLPENVCEPPTECDPKDPICMKIRENYPWVCANNICSSGKDPEKDCCTTDVRQKCYQHCLPRNYAEPVDTGIGATSAVIYKKLSGTEISSWCMEPYHYSTDANPGCKLDESATTKLGIETGTKCMSIANEYDSDLAKDAEWRHLRKRLAYPGQVTDKNNKPLPWATHKDWADGGACNKPDYNTNAIMLEHLLYHKGCGSIQHNMRTKEDWSRDLFQKDTGIELPPGSVCDLSSKDFDELIVQDKSGKWVDNELGLFEGQPYCDTDVTKDDCRDYCWSMCSGVDYDLSKYYKILEKRSDDGDEKLKHEILMKFAIIAGVIGAGIVVLLLFLSPSGPSEEERLMEELEG